MTGIIRTEETKWLPGTVRERIEDLCKNRHIRQAELADAAGIDRSTLSRFCSGKTDTLANDNVVKIANHLNVSTDFLLGETDIPERISYDISELGLTVKAAENLYTRKVDPEILCELLEHERCGEIFSQISAYWDGQLSAGIATQNQMIQSIRGLLSIQAEIQPDESKAAADASQALQGMKISSYEAEVEPIQRGFGTILRDIKRKKPDRALNAAKLTQETFGSMVKFLLKGKKNLRQITPEALTEAIIRPFCTLDVPPEFAEEMDAARQNIRNGLYGFFTVLLKAKEKENDQSGTVSPISVR